MGWVRHAAKVKHSCEPPGVRPNAFGHMIAGVGALDDLWRCEDCGELWRVGRACDVCDYRRADGPHQGQHAVGVVWRPATVWQRLRYRRSATIN